MRTPRSLGPRTAGRARHRSRRDRHGRGLRGPLLPHVAPAWRSRAERFDDIVLDVVDHLERTIHEELQHIDFLVDEVPDVPAGQHVDEVPLVDVEPAEAGQSARLTLYRKPIEWRAQSLDDLRGLVHDLVVEHVSDLLGRDPDDIDPPA